VVLEIRQHLLEDGALLNALGRVARFDEFGADDRCQLVGFAEAGFALRGDGVAFGVNVDRSVHLARGRDAQI
jgi:hypothetical protein